VSTRPRAGPVAPSGHGPPSPLCDGPGLPCVGPDRLAGQGWRS